MHEPPWAHVSATAGGDVVITIACNRVQSIMTERRAAKLRLMKFIPSVINQA
jgi:hypothetical protein